MYRERQDATCENCRMSTNPRIKIASCLALIAMLAVITLVMLPSEMMETSADDPTSGECGGGLTWNFETTDEGTLLKITKGGSGDGHMTDYESGKAPWYYNRGIITELFIDHRVTAIGTNAFKDLSVLGAIVISPEAAPELVSIGDNAFNGCSSLTGMSFLSTLENLEVIGPFAFYKCGNISTNLTIPQNVTTIQESAFEGCTFTSSDATILFDGDKLETIGDRAFSGCHFQGSFYLPEGVTEIGVRSFENNGPYVGDLELPMSLNKLGQRAFYKCEFTGKLLVSDSIESNGTFPFEDCIFRKGFEIVDGTVTIKSYMLAAAKFYCPLSMPITVKTIERNVCNGTKFYCGDNGINTIPDSVNYLGTAAFMDAEFYKDDTAAKEKAELRISNNLTYIGKGAFQGCIATVNDLILSSNLTFVGEDAFNKNNHYDNPPLTIKKLTVMNGCSGINECAFRISVPSTQPTYDYTYHFYKEEEKINEITDYNGPDFVGHVFEMQGEFKDWTGTLVNKGTVTQHAVKYDIDGGSGNKPIQSDVLEGQKFKVAYYSGTKTGFAFVAWNCSLDSHKYYPGDEITMGTSDITLTAIWIEERRVEYDADGGSSDAPETKNYKKGDQVTVETYTGVKKGYGFGGWTYDGILYKPGDKFVMGTKNILFLAKWVPLHKVTYDIDGGSGQAPVQDDVQEGSTFTAKSYTGTKTGYLYEGWIYDGKIYKAGDTITMGKKDIIILAVWTETHKVTYDLDGGSGTAPTQPDVAKGHTFIVKGCTATKEGFVFKGWSYDRLTFQEGDVITMELEDITLTAVWKKGLPTHKVTYDLDGGSGTAPVQPDVEEGKTFTVKLYTGTKDGYVFKGWSYDDRTYNMGATITMGTKDIVLKAVWGDADPEEKEDYSKFLIPIAVAAGAVTALMIGISIVRRP